jgi:hypothetical protein
VPAKTDPVIVIADGTGEQLGATSGTKQPQELAMQLWSAVRETKARFDAQKAEQTRAKAQSQSSAAK